MTPILNFKSGLKDLIAKSLDKCIECLEFALDKNIAENINALTLYKGEINRLKKQQLDGTIKYSRIDRHYTELTWRLLNFIDSLTDSDISDFSVLVDKTQKSILVISKPEKEADMRAFFAKHYFPKVDFMNYGQNLPAESFDVILLEDMPTGSVSEDKMRFYLAKSDAFFLYFGDGFFPKKLKDDFGDKVYFANSPFSLYARLNELLDYLKYFGK